LNQAVFFNLIGLLLTAAIGWVAARVGWLKQGTPASDASRVLSNAAMYIFIPALLFRTAYRLDLATMPWRIVAAFLVPAALFLLAWYAFAKLRARPQDHPAGPAARAISASYGNSVQLGIPMAAAVFGEAGLGLHLAIVGFHGLFLLTLLTVLVEVDLARAATKQAQGSAAARWGTALTTLKHTLMHPVLVPLFAGLAWQLLGLPMPEFLDRVLQQLGLAAVPLAVVLIGVSLAEQGVAGHLKGAFALTLGKLIVMPALVFVVGRFAFGLSGMPLQVITMMAALPAGTNALIFAQRYNVMQAQATAAIVVSTLAFVLTSVVWLVVLARWA
jgi:malonate transporter and related proteins